MGRSNQYEGNQGYGSQNTSGYGRDDSGRGYGNQYGSGTGIGSTAGMTTGVTLFPADNTNSHAVSFWCAFPACCCDQKSLRRE